MKQQPQDDPTIANRGSSDAESGDVIAEGVTPWDILAYIGQAYDRLKQIRTTLYQMRHDLLVLPRPQASVLSDVLLHALPMTVYSVVEALQVLAKMDTDLLPRSQVHRKTLSKWEMYRDDSAHFALRAFFVANNRHELKQFFNEDLCGGATFAYDFESDQFCAGDNQRISVNDALDAIRGIYKDVGRRLSRESEKYPLESILDPDISRTIAFYDGSLDEDIDRFNEYDCLFQENYTSRANAVLEMLRGGPKLREDIYAALGLPRSITEQVLSRMAGLDKTIQGVRTDDGWLLSQTKNARTDKNG